MQPVTDPQEGTNGMSEHTNGATSGAPAILVLTLAVIGLVAACGISKRPCDAVLCPTGKVCVADESGGTCVSTGDGGNGVRDAGLSCSGPITCSAAQPCDWATAQKSDTWCSHPPPGSPPSIGIWTKQCGDGYSALVFTGLDSSLTYYYLDDSLVAIVAEGGQPLTCTQGPTAFAPPICGPLADLCPAVDAGPAAGSDAPDIFD